MSTMDDRDQRIRDRAEQIWIEEGRPDGRADIHWDMATELVAIEDGQNDTLLPIGEAGEPVEPILALENTGEFPTMTDQGEMQNPHWPSKDEADEGPVSEIDTIHRTLEVPKEQRGKPSPVRSADGGAAPRVGSERQT